MKFCVLFVILVFKGANRAFICQLDKPPFPLLQFETKSQQQKSLSFLICRSQLEDEHRSTSNY